MGPLSFFTGICHLLLALCSAGKVVPPARDHAALEIRGTLTVQPLDSPFGKPLFGEPLHSFTVLVDQGQGRRVRWTLDLMGGALYFAAKRLNGKRVVVGGEPLF